MSEKMKAVVLHGPDNYPDNYEVTEIDKPVCGDGEILLKMKVASICGTDKKIFTGAKTKDVRPDSVVGHEFSGIIEEVGKNVKGFAAGDRVSIANVIPCGHCVACLSGHENACMERKAIGYEFNGGFAEYVLIPEICVEAGNVIKLPDDVSFAAGAIIEPLACCIRGFKNTGTQFGDTVLIIGAGPIGLMHTQLNIAGGAKKVYVSDFDAKKRAIAESFGAVGIDPTAQDIEQFIKEETGGLGVDRVVMTVGINDMVNQMFKICKKFGTVCLFAGFPRGKTSVIDPSIIHYNEIKVTGSSAYKREDYLQAAGMVFEKKIDLDALVSDRFALEDFRKALDLHMEATGLKIVIED